MTTTARHLQKNSSIGSRFNSVVGCSFYYEANFLKAGNAQKNLKIHVSINYMYSLKCLPGFNKTLRFLSKSSLHQQHGALVRVTWVWTARTARGKSIHGFFERAEWIRRYYRGEELIRTYLLVDNKDSVSIQNNIKQLEQKGF